MTEYLQQTPQLQFTLALVELQIYELSEAGGKPLLVIPQIVARTREIIRAVVKVEGVAVDSVKITLDTPEIDISDDRPSGKRHIISEEEYFYDLSQRVDVREVEFARKLIKDMEEFGCIIDWKQGSFVVKLSDPAGSGKKLTLFVVRKDGLIYQAWLEDQLQSLALPKEIAFDYYRESTRLFGRKLAEVYHNGVFLKDLHQHYSEFTDVFKEIIDRIREAAKE